MTLRARDIADICDDIPLERVSVTTQEGWDYQPKFTVMFGPLAYRQTLEIDPKMSLDAVRAKLEAARASPLAERPSPALEAKSPPAATPATGRGKRRAAKALDE